MIFLASRVAGTRQVRRRINHMIFSSRTVCGNPDYLTFSPNPKNSVWTGRLFRTRKNDPAMTHGYPEFADYCGFDKPSVVPLTSEEGEGVLFDIPDHDLRRKMTGRDPLSELLQFEVHLYVIIPKLFGHRF